MSSKEFTRPDYESFVSTDEVDKEIENTKNEICRKAKQMFQTKETKKEAVAAFNEQLKELNEEIDHNLGVLDELVTRKRVIESSADLPA